MGKLDDRVALITGAGRGIGRSLALKLAADGAAVVVNDLDADHTASTTTAIESAGGRAIGLAGSVTDPGFGESFVQAAVDAFGGVDIIVNNAGYTWDSAVQRMSDEQWDAMLAVHLTAPFRILRAAQPVIRAAAKAEAEAGGSVRCRKIVNVSSLAGTVGHAGQVNYSTAKAGVIGLTRSLAREWGRFNVTVNAVAFGLIETRLTASTETPQEIDVDGHRIAVGFDRSILDRATATTPLGRAGTVEDAANGIYLFCIPESDFVTAEVLTVSGGFIS
jgi:3-oxoacyl-[acyl-carrier protein] reductase